MGYLKYLFNNYRKLTGVFVEYSLVSKSGNVIHIVEETIIPKQVIIRNCGDYDWVEWRNEIIKLYEDRLMKRALELLNEYQHEKPKMLPRGYLDGGDYIVKCVWSVNREICDITYEEYKKYVEYKNGCNK